MDLGPTSITKSSSNSHLLKLLTRRCAKSVGNLNKKDNDWPGKYKPSITNVIVIKRDSNISNQVQFDK